MPVLIRRWIGWLLFATVAGAAAMLLAPAPATGHAIVLDTSPSDADLLDAPPETVTVTFNEPIRLPPDGAQIVDAHGEQLPTEASTRNHTVEITAPSDMGEGTFVVDWRVISADGHPVSGAFIFSVGQASEVTATVPSVTGSTLVSVLHTSAQALVYLGLLGAVGLVFFLLLTVTADLGRVRRRARHLTTAMSGLAVVGLSGHLLTEGAWSSGAGASGLVDPGLLGRTLLSGAGLAAVLGAVGLALVVGLASRITGSGAVRGSRLGLYVGMALALASLTLTGHTRTFGPSWLVIGADLLHVMVASAWFGGLLGLALTLGSREVSVRSAARVVSRFSAVAALLLLVLAATGIVLGWRILPGLGALTSTGYGVTLLVKLGVVVVVVVIAAANRYLLVPRITHGGFETEKRSTLRRTVSVEAALMVVVLIVTGFLVSRDPTGAEDSTLSGPVTFQESLGEHTLDVHVTPVSVGRNTVEITITDSEGAAVVPHAPPEIRLTLREEIGPLTPDVSGTGPGEYLVDAHIPTSGEWELEISVRLSTYESPVLEFPLEIS